MAFQEGTLGGQHGRPDGPVLAGRRENRMTQSGMVQG